MVRLAGDVVELEQPHGGA